MKRTGFAPRKQTLSQRAKLKRAANPLKPDTRSAVKKGPLRDPDHLARIRQMPCVVCGASGVHAHHSRVGLRTMGVRKSDETCLPLCPKHHDKLHSMNEGDFWIVCNISPLEVAAALYAETLRLRSKKEPTT